MSLIDKKQGLGQRKPLGSSPKIPSSKEKKDTTAFYGDSVATPEERRTWLRRHANEVFRITRGRVTSSKIKEYEKKLAASKWGPFIEKYKREPKLIEIEMKKALHRAKNDAERVDIKEDIEVAKRMFGWGKR